jgi:hypothetical protein
VYNWKKITDINIEKIILGSARAIDGKLFAFVAAV